MINVPDKKLKRAINFVLGKDRKPDDDITKNEMEFIKELRVDKILGYLRPDEPGRMYIESLSENLDRGVRSLEGLQYAINLETLDLSENRISDLTPLSNLKKLEYLELDRNIVEDLTPLSKVKSLKHLNIYNNENIVDTQPLANLTNLEWMDMHFCNRGKHTVNVKPLSNLVNLEYLSIESNFIEDISFAKNLKKLKSFSCAVNYVTDVTPVERLTDVAYDDADDDLFLNMFNQSKKDTVKIEVDSNGKTVNIDAPKGLEKYIKKYYADVDIPIVDLKKAEKDDFIKAQYNNKTNKIEVIVDPNKNKNSRKTECELFINYDWYCLTIKISIDQKGCIK
ncbi:hypothetical protein C3495_11750 [Clostridiaceae bacterium 14S0207]|nr:hypothetical protein C3495_11750 [Clostridiaceae bacterium 14S0207]